MAMPVCRYKVNGRKCGRLSVAIVKIKAGKLQQNSAASVLREIMDREDQDNQPMGIGVGSQWLPVCELHINAYPDHDGVHV